MSPETILSIFIASIIGPVLTIVVTSYVQRRKLKADAESALGGALEGAGSTMEKLFKRLNDLDEWKTKAEERIIYLEDELRRYADWSARLVKHVQKIDPDEKFGKAPQIDTDPKIRALLRGEKHGNV